MDDTAPAVAAADRPRLDDQLRRFGGRVLREPALLLSLAYLATSALGLWASYWLYRPFGIAIFDYMQPSDLLVAGLRDPVYLLLVLVGFLVGWGTGALDRYRFADAERVRRWRTRWWGRMLWVPRWRERMAAVRSRGFRRFLRLAVMPYLALMFVYIYTQYQAEQLARGLGTPLQVRFAGDAAAEAGHPELLGTTSAWVFVYWPHRRRAEAIAQQSLRSLAYPPVAPRH